MACVVCMKDHVQEGELYIHKRKTGTVTQILHYRDPLDPFGDINHIGLTLRFPNGDKNKRPVVVSTLKLRSTQ
jgi:hypothetical protein